MPTNDLNGFSLFALCTKVCVLAIYLPHALPVRAEITLRLIKIERGAILGTHTHTTV